MKKILKNIILLYLLLFLPFELNVVLAETKTNVVTWRMLRKLHSISHIPHKLKSLDKKKVRLRGFMVPLEGNKDEVIEFLLVPVSGMCIHLPPPPANQSVYVTVKKGNKISHSFEAVRVTGILTIKSVDSEYGAAYYSIKADQVF